MYINKFVQSNLFKKFKESSRKFKVYFLNFLVFKILTWNSPISKCNQKNLFNDLWPIVYWDLKFENRNLRWYLDVLNLHHLFYLVKFEEQQFKRVSFDKVLN